ncbi:MAG TPA: 50S ribosomal protein L11 methyltransferase [Candidatus Binataceae bacterium]
MTAVAKRASYTKVVFHTPAAMADEAAGLLVANGALGCAVAEMARPGTRPRAVVTLEAYFDSIAPERLMQMKRAMADAGMLHAVVRDGVARRVVDPGWATLWKKRFGPFRVGRRILVVPPWNKVREKGRVTIVISPARAFGTGHHPTTAGALRAIEELAASARVRHALDVGTGSGVLALAMNLLGVSRVLAIDIDPDAVENARENATLCGIGAQIRFSSTPLKSIRGRFDLVTANILSASLAEMAPRLATLTRPGGRLVLGGILASEAAEVLEHYRTRFRCLHRRVNRGWATLVLAR